MRKRFPEHLLFGPRPFLLIMFLGILVLNGFARKAFAQNKSAVWDTAKMHAVVRLASASLDFKPQTTDSFARLLYTQARAAGNIDYLGKAASLISISEVKLNSQPSLVWYDTAMYYLSQTKNEIWMANTNVQIGNSFGSKLQYELGIRFLLKAAANFVRLKDTAMLISTYSALSNTFSGFGDYKSEKKYAELAVALLEQIRDKNPDRRWGTYAILANSYSDNKEYNKALAIHTDNIKNAGNDWVFFLSYTNVGNTLLQMKAYPEAEVYFLKSLPYAQKINDPYSFATMYNNLSRTNFYLQRYKEAKQYLNQALAYTEQNYFPEKSLDVYETGALLETALNNPKAALDYTTKRTAIKDSLLNAERFRTVYNMQIKYESAEKEKENQRLQYANKIKTIEKEKAESDKRRLIVGAVAALVLLSILFSLLYRNKIIKTRLQEEQVFTKAVIEGEQNERIRIARDLHDSIGQILSVAKMNISTWLYEFPDHKIAHTSADLVDKAVTELRNISHNLLPEDLELGLFQAIENICEKISVSGKTQVTLSVSDALKDRVFEKSNQLTIYRIVQEVLNNMVKHAQATTITIAVKLMDKNKISILINDDGKGFDTATIKQSSGIGWKNIAARVSMLDGKMQVRSELLTGTQIDILIPAV